MGKTFDLSVIFRVLDRASTPLDKVTGKFRSMIIPIDVATKNIQRMGVALNETGRRMKSIGRELSMKITLPLVAFGTLAFKASMDLNASMANVATLIPENVKRINELKEATKRMAYDVGISTETVGEGLYQIISFLGDSADTEKILEINSKAAAAGLATVKDSVDLTSAAMKGYNDISAKTAQKTADLAFQTVKLGATTFPELASAMRGSIAWAAQLDLRIEELFASFATLSGVTGSTSEVGTQMEAIMRGLVKATPEMKKAIKKLGYESAKTMIKERGLSASLKALSKYTKGSEEAMTKLFGRAEPLMAVFSLTGKTAGIFKDNLDAMTKSSGAMEDAFRKQTQGINKAGFIWKQFKVQVVELHEEFGDVIGEVLMPVMKVIGKIVHWMGKWDKTTKIFVLTLGTFVAAIGPLLIFIGALVASIGAIAAIATPVLIATFIALGLAFVGISAAIYQVIKHWDELKQVWQEWSVWVVTLTNIVVDFITAPFKALDEFILSVFSKIDRVAEYIKKIPGVASFQAGVQEVGKKGFVRAGLEALGVLKSQTEVNIKVSSDSGSTATVEKVKKVKGDAITSVATIGYVGRTH